MELEDETPVVEAREFESGIEPMMTSMQTMTPTRSSEDSDNSEDSGSSENSSEASTDSHHSNEKGTSNSFIRSYEGKTLYFKCILIFVKLKVQICSETKFLFY
jgi:hypothetical protein